MNIRLGFKFVQFSLLFGLLSLICPLAFSQQAQCTDLLGANTRADTYTRAEETAKDRGFLFEMTKSGKTSWLYGTMHALKPEWAALGPKLRQITEQASSIALEIDMTSLDMSEAMKKILAAVPRFQLNADGMRQLTDAAKDRCKLAEQFVQMVPALGLFFLESYERQKTGTLETLSMESLLTRQAKLLQKPPIISLETFETQRRMVERIMFAKDEQELLKRLEFLKNGKVLEVLTKLVEAWANSNSQFFDSYYDWCECRDDPEIKALMDEINGKRNKGMVDSIERLHREQPGPILYAIGALHLFLDDSIPDLLRKKGFEVKSVPFSGK